MNTFDRAVLWVISREGGATVTNDPNDPGGLTKYGISQRAFPDVDIRALTYETAAELYREHYWNRCRCGEFPPALGLALFDSAVNQGPGVAVRLMQRALGVKPDGVVGPDTLAAAARVGVSGFITDYVERRWDHYSELGSASHYLRGWTRRLFRLQAECMRLTATNGGEE
jgi:lysozyme family protein